MLGNPALGRHRDIGWLRPWWLKLTLGRKIIRVGTDDAEELAKVIREKTGLKGGEP